MTAQQTAELPRNEVLVGDVRDVLPRLPDASIDTVVTSPPYFQLRNYGEPGQFGTEPDVDAWVEHVRSTVAEIHRLLTPTGSLWLNLGDTYSTHVRQGGPRKSLLLGPERLIRVLVADGWSVRNKVIWHKTNPVPTSVTDRLASTWEVVYLLTRSQRYFFDLDSVRVPHSSSPPAPRKAPDRLPADYGHERWRGTNADSTTGLDTLKRLGRSGHPLGKNPGDVWQIATARSGKGHHAVFPAELARRAIRAGCPEARCSSCCAPWHRPLHRSPDGTARRGQLTPACRCDAAREPGVVLDPFLGTGTTAIVAEELGRDWLGVELNPAFAQMAEGRLARHRSRHSVSARGSPA